MSILFFEKQVIGKGKRPRIVRRQHCGKCHNVLALQLTDKIDHQREADYYVAKDCVWAKGEPHLLYSKERWFGNTIRCPVCGSQVTLPIDKPLSYERMQEAKEIRNAS